MTEQPVSDLSSQASPKFQPLGTFDMTSGEVMVTDPCYEPGNGLNLKLSNVRTGKWQSSVILQYEENWGPRVAVLLASHTDTIRVCRRVYRAFRQELGDIGVDSGQAGIFDARHYKDHSVIAPDHEWKPNPYRDRVSETPNPAGDKMILMWEHIRQTDPWYMLCCEASQPHADTIPHGVVCSSGRGDGIYSCITSRNKSREIQAIAIRFLDLDQAAQAEKLIRVALSHRQQ